jgi:hypothetical protein
MPPKKLFLDISSPRRTSPVVAFSEESVQQDNETVFLSICISTTIYSRPAGCSHEIYRGVVVI